MRKYNCVGAVAVIMLACVPWNCFAGSPLVKASVFKIFVRPLAAGLVSGVVTYKLGGKHPKKIAGGVGVAATAYLVHPDVQFYRKSRSQFIEIGKHLKVELVAGSVNLYVITSDNPGLGVGGGYDSRNAAEAQVKLLQDIERERGRGAVKDVIKKSVAFAAGAVLGYKIMNYLQQRSNKATLERSST